MIDIFNDDEFQSLPTERKKSIAKNYFNTELADEEFNKLPEADKEEIYNRFYNAEVSKEIDIETTKKEIQQEEYSIRKEKIEALPEETREQKLAKKKAIVSLEENKENPSIVDSILMGAEVSARNVIAPFVGIAEVGEDIANLFREEDSTTIGEWRKKNQKTIKVLEEKLGYKEGDFLTPSLAGRVGGEIATVATGQKALSALGKTATVAKTALMEGTVAGLGEYGTTGEPVEAVRAGAISAGITGAIGKLIEGRSLNKTTKKALDESSPEELENIANIYKFAEENDIKIVDAMLSNNPNKIIYELKSANAPEALIDYAEEIRSDTGKKLLDAFNDVFTGVKPKNIEDIELKKIANMMQEESTLLKKEMNNAKRDAYNKMKDSDLGRIETDISDVMDIGLQKLREYRGDSSLINAFKRNILKNTKTLDSKQQAVADRIQSLQRKISNNEQRLAGMEIEGLDTASIEKVIERDIAELNVQSENIDMSKISNLSLEDIVGVIQDMNELKYSGSAHVATKGAKEQEVLDEINKALMSKIESTNKEYSKLAKDASEKARKVFELFGKQGRGIYEFPELEKIRLSRNPDDIAKTIFKTDATESGYKIEQTLEILGSRNPELKKKVMGKYIDNVTKGIDSYAKGKNTVKRSILDLDESTKAIDKLIGSPDSKRLTVKILGEENTDTLFKLNNFIKQHKENLDAMKTPTEKQEAGMLSYPVLKQVKELLNYTVYKTRNIGIYKDKYHSTEYQKKVNRYITNKLNEFEEGKKSKVDWNRLGYALSGSTIEKYIAKEMKEED